MNHTANYNADQRIIEAIFHGEIAIVDFHEIVDRVTKLSLTHNCFLWIFDYRKASLNLNAFEMAHFIFSIRDACESLGEKSQYIKRANIIPADLEEPELLNSVVMSNFHNGKVKQFPNYRDALSWLYSIQYHRNKAIPVGKPHRLITIQTSMRCDVKTVWSRWNSVEDIYRWFRQSEQWDASSIVHNLSEGGAFKYCIETKDKKNKHVFAGHFQHIFKERLIIYAIEDGRMQKVIFHPYNDETIVTVTLEADEVTMLAYQQKAWQDILDNFKEFVEQYIAELESP